MKRCMLLVALLITSCSEPVAEEVPQPEPDIVYVTEHIWHETTIETTVDVYHTTVVVEEDTTPDVIETTEYVYPSGPVPCLVLVEEGVPAMADSPLSGLTAATQVNDADLMLITQGGTSKKATAELIRALAFQDPRKGFIDHTEWLRWFGDTEAYRGETGWRKEESGTGASVDVATGNIYGRVHGILNCRPGTTASGAARAMRGVANLQTGDGETEFETSVALEDLSDGTDRFAIFTGFADSTYGAGSRDGIGFYYKDDVNSGKFLCSCEANGTETTADSGITVAADTWYNLEALVNAGGTSVAFYIDGSLVATITTNIPTGTSRLFGAYMEIVKSLGTTQRDFWTDYFQIRKRFTSLR